MKKWILVFMTLGLASCLGQSLESLLWEKLGQRVAAFDKDMDGVLGVAVVDLTTGKRWGYHADTLFTQASLIKVPLLIEVFRLKEAGQLRFDEKVTIRQAEVVGGSGVLRNRLTNGAVTVPVEEIVREMVASSDNTATNWLIRRVGMANVNKTMRELGFNETKLQRVMIDQAAASRNEENVSTPDEMATMLERIYRGQILSKPACEGMLNYMRLVKDDMRKAVPAEIDVASKPGEVTGVRTETGIVYLKNRPFVLSVMGSYLSEEQVVKSSPVEMVTRIVFAHMSKLDAGNAFGNLGVR
jgi:beta-lactamase class A